nr:hypothetical protein [Burkholderiales bacterium]
MATLDSSLPDAQRPYLSFMDLFPDPMTNQTAFNNVAGAFMGALSATINTIYGEFIARGDLIIGATGDNNVRFDNT